MKTMHWVLAVLLASATAASLAYAERQRSRISEDRNDAVERDPREPRSAEGREEWEYLVVSGGNVNLSPTGSSTMRKEPGAFSREWFPIEHNLDKLGAKGWELVAVAGSNDPVYFLKRRK
jgi:hypothetical protein